ncbi:hypothetical protein, partial [Nostoc sp. CHAB 5715]|uniref:hypothetical protein n=1 Tax=Nostoc sp. CHAB 5715 TaxID=2780400 RepID=UPI001E2A3547
GLCSERMGLCSERMGLCSERIGKTQGHRIALIGEPGAGKTTHFIGIQAQLTIQNSKFKIKDISDGDLNPIQFS